MPVKGDFIYLDYAKVHREAKPIDHPDESIEARKLVGPAVYTTHEDDTVHSVTSTSPEELHRAYLPSDPLGRAADALMAVLTFQAAFKFRTTGSATAYVRHWYRARAGDGGADIYADASTTSTTTVTVYPRWPEAVCAYYADSRLYAWTSNSSVPAEVSYEKVTASIVVGARLK